MTKKSPPIGLPWMNRQLVCRWGGVLPAFLCVAVFSSAIVADDENVVEYRRIFAPEEKIPSLSLEPSVPLNRQIFEAWVSRLEQKSDEHESKQPVLSKIILKGKLEGRQLVSGQGSFTLHPRGHETDTIPLDPLSLAINSLRWTDDSDAILFCEPNGGNRLLIPSATRSSSGDHIQFRWSLQSRQDIRTGIVFDFALPPCLSIELQLDLPESQKLNTSAGLVLPHDGNATDHGYRTWRVLLGHHSHATLTITTDRALPSVEQKSAIRQLSIYSIKPIGLESETHITFDRMDSRPEELLFELEMPLRPVEVKYGNRPVTWTRSAVSADITEVRIDLSPFMDEEPQELVMKSLGPLMEKQHWVLPRVRVTSSDIFWIETRCAVSIYTPLRVRNLVYDQAVQVLPRSTTTVDWTDRELYVFQFFREDARIELEVVHSIPPLTTQSVVQTNWSDNGIRGDVFLDCNVTEGERFNISFPVSEHWVIDDVTSYLPTGTFSGEYDPISSWDILGGELVVQLNSPLHPRSPVTLRLSCRFINSSQTQFRLSELSPLKWASRHGEAHYIALQLDSTAFSLKSNVDASRFDIPRSIMLGNNPLILNGDVFPLNSQNQDIRFELEQTRSLYTADIAGNIYVDDNGLMPTFRIVCTPNDSPISRIFVHFTPTGEGSEPGRWDWSLVGSSEASRPLRVRKMLPEETGELLLVSEQQHWNENIEHGEIWEIRFDEAQTTPFALLAFASVPLADSMLIPFASLPLASIQKGEIVIESPHFEYRIMNARLDSIPIAPPERDRYQNIRAAFRYDPQEELRRSQHSPLWLEKLTPDDHVDTAWVLSLRLDSQYEPEGVVRNRAMFLVENQGKDVLRIKLPQMIEATNVSSVRQDSQQIPWDYDANQKTIDVVLPVGQRFVSISVEYIYKDIPLIQQRKLRPYYPSVDVPILSGNWFSWFPPEFDVSVRYAPHDVAQRSAKPIVLSKALDYLLMGTYRSFLGMEWDNAWHGKQRRKETEAAAQYFFEAIVRFLRNKSTATWGDLMGDTDETILANVKSRLDNTELYVVTQLLIHKQALAFLGITPDTPIENIGSIQNTNVREKLFEQMGLVLLVATRTRSDRSKEYTFALTTPTLISLNRQFQPIPTGHCVCIVPFEIFDSESMSSPSWTSGPNWIKETTLSPIPWSVSAQSTQWTTLTPNWNAYELPMDIEQPLYIVHRQKFLAIQWIAFLAFVLVTCRKPFSSPIIMFALLVTFELVARSVAPCYIGIPSGALLGVLVSWAFMLIRSHFVPVDLAPIYPARDDSTECSISFVPMPLVVRSLLFFGVLIGLSTSAVSQSVQEQVQDSARKEPYRVFYPADSEGHVVGDHVWLPSEFFKLLRRNAEPEDTIVSQRGHIIKATYQGSLIRGTSGNLECSEDFKVVYDVYIDSSNATIALPNLPVVQGKFRWDSRPIQPNWEDDAKSSALSFSVNNEMPGKHTLEIALSPKVIFQNGSDTNRISFAIPKIPHSTLRLNVPPDSPPVNVPEALGAVTVNSPSSPAVMAELGATEQLTLSWNDDPNRSGVHVSEVEQFFWIWVRPTQIELNALFRFRIDGGKIQHLMIQDDPRWTRSGPFRCDEHTTIATHTEANSESHFLDNFANNPSNVSRVDFQSPVSGPLTLRANFVLRGSDPNVFNVVGNLRLPEFKTLASRITKSMLAVSADPVLELDLPAEGRSRGFEAGWYGTTTTVSSSFIFGENSLWRFGEDWLSERSYTSRERPEVAYDLTKIKPTWTVNIRTKKPVPTVEVAQSVQFDTGESKVHTVGKFSSEANSYVFRQLFFADPLLQIEFESIEVRNSQNVLIESRCQKIAPEQYLIFFKNPVTGKYTITIRGIFETTEIQDKSPQEPFLVPMLTFGEARTTNRSLNFFRTSAVIATVSSIDTKGWTMLSAIPTAPEPFTQSLPLGIWQKSDTASSETLPSDRTTEEEWESEPPRFDLRSNRPKVQCRTVLSLDTNADAHWIMKLDFTGNITDGEVKSLSFQWDEHCGNNPTVEPKTASWSLDQSGGQRILTLSLAEPMRGEQQFKITVPLDTTGATVALPSVFPLDRGIVQLESEIIVDLPHKLENKMIPWELSMLEEVEGQTTESSRLHYRVVDSKFSAKIPQVDSRLTAVLYDIVFLIKRDGSLLGAATVDLKNQRQESFVLQMPPGYEPIHISFAGTILDRMQLGEENRWQINLGRSDYPQRFSMIFRAPPLRSLKYWNRGLVAATLQLPILEDVDVQETLWTTVFEGNVPMLDVESAWVGSEKTYLGKCVPISGVDALLALVSVNLIRENNLIHILRSLPVSSRKEEMQRWFSHWSDEWNTVAEKIDPHIIHWSPQNIKQNLFIRPANPDAEGTETIGAVRSFLRTMAATTPRSLKENWEQSVREKFTTVTETQSKPTGPSLNSHVYWQGHISGEMRYLFGVEEGILQEIGLTSKPDEGNWVNWLLEHFWLGISFSLLIPIFVLLSVRWVHLMELWLQFSHFWGMAIGVLLWTFLPESFLGLIIIVLTFMSLFRPAWTQHRFTSKPF